MINELTPFKRKALEKKGLDTDEKVRRYFPTSYIDYTHPSLLMNNVPDDKGYKCAILGTIESITPKVSGSGKDMVNVKCVEYNTGTPFTIILMNMYKAEEKIALCYGKLTVFMGTFKYSKIFGYSSFNPLWSDDVNGNLRIHAHYPKIQKVADTTWQEELKTALQEGESDNIPENLRPGYDDINTALNKIHYPKNMDEIQQGYRRIILDDLVGLHKELNKLKQDDISTDLVFEKTAEMEGMINSLPYKLTKGQYETVMSLIDTTKQNKCISALIQGDVGCGKTIVAFSLMRCAAENGYQSVLMAPTQILAGQHLIGLSELVGRENIAYFDASLTKKQKKELATKVKNNEYLYIVGTHSLLNDVEYDNIALAIVDEEHRFGVEQKNKLFGHNIHTVMLSATPIPRSCAQAVYGNTVEIYQITDKPAGRKETITYYDDGKKVKNFIYMQVKKKQQVYVVCPMIEENEDTDSENALDLVSAEALYAEYKTDYGRLGMTVGLVTGKMKAEEKDTVLDAFKKGDIDILISTTVIEVGVNVPNANTMVIMNTERFGLSTLHQLRGRVGRGNDQGYCVLVSDSCNDRIRTMCETTDGFKIAEADMSQRGPGDILGIEQSGKNRLLTELVAYPDINEDAKKIAAIIT